MAVVEILLFLLLLIVMFCFRNYKKDELEKLFPEENALGEFANPFVYFVLSRTRLIGRFMKKSKHVEKITRLDINYSKKDAVSRFLIRAGKNMVLVLMAVLFLASIADALIKEEGELKPGNRIMRPETGEGEKSVRLSVKMQKDGKEITEKINVKVGDKKLSYKEYEEEVSKAVKYLDRVVPGDNRSVDYVDKPINMVSKIPDSHLKISWELGLKPYFKENGQFTERLKEEKTLTSVTALLSYGDWVTEYEMYFLLFPPDKSWEEKARQSLALSLSREEETSSRQSVYVLPESGDGVDFSYQEPEEKMNGKILISGILAMMIILPLMLEAMGKKMEKRELEMMLDYPEIVNKLTLLLGAGLTIPKAWGRIVEEYEKKGKFRYAYEEAKRTLRDMENGTSVAEAVEDFGKRIQLIPYMKFSSLIVQNMKKGTENLLSMLEYEAMEAFRERKETAKRLGEQAGTKLLFPMMVMMGLVFGIILLPAISGF